MLQTLWGLKKKKTPKESYEIGNFFKREKFGASPRLQLPVAMGRVAVIAHLRPLLLAIQALDSAPPVTAKQDREIMGKKSGRHRAIRVQLLGEKGDLQGGATITLLTLPSPPPHASLLLVHYLWPCSLHILYGQWVQK